MFINGEKSKCSSVASEVRVGLKPWIFLVRPRRRWPIFLGRKLIFQYLCNPHIPTSQEEKLKSGRERLVTYKKRFTGVMMAGLFIVIPSTLKLLYCTVK